MSGVNTGLQSNQLKQPSSLELVHDFLWRQVVALPPKGMIGILTALYERFLFKCSPSFDTPEPTYPKYKQKFGQRYQDINALERHLERNGTLSSSFFLHVSRGEQKKRFLERLCDSSKHWKFSEADMHERDFWNDYIKAYECMLSATSTKWAPWFIIPADYKWVARTIVADIITSSIIGLGIEKPEVSKEKLAAIEAAKAKLEAE
jgi:polyphosphate kinase 2 (PPK2 family)